MQGIMNVMGLDHTKTTFLPPTPESMGKLSSTRLVTWCQECWGVCVYVLGCVQLFVTPRTIARQAPLSVGFSRQEN